MTIIFDLFGVLLSSSFPSAQEKLTQLLNRAPEIIAPVYRKWEADFDLDRIDSRTFWRHINNELGTNVDWHELNTAVLESIHPLPGSFALLEDLRNYPLVLLSNTRREWYEYLEARYSFSRFFSSIFLSYEIQLSKPDPRIYASVLKELSLPPQELLYIDDSPQNIAAAAKLGIPSILFTNAQQTHRVLSERIIFNKVI